MRCVRRRPSTGSTSRMIKYLPSATSVVLEEIPDMVSIAVDISNCRGNCVGCHSPWLQTDIGEELTREAVDRIIGENFGVNCFLFLGEGRDPQALTALASYISTHHGLRVALYSGRTRVEEEFYEVFDYIKLGPYIASNGPLNKPTTNQRLYRITRLPGQPPLLEDVTSRFWHRGLEESGT